ncbi:MULTISPECIES: carbohydrate ABC transporter permease [Rathayibacter]|jgi:multiple sugar transport system permease protein|uniref:carbohydrate ABC transporter permease n=1 Tax=Rathayibacter TaxID=33886 RepID=UPI000F4B2CC1|nr:MULTISPECIES: sugar ABC transporter permease [Rathayibacter]MDY0911960.1 sugar ABC transporter permease [Rathayibacter festucae]NQX17650.1 sugar ABC transporter permease [Rathayibacter sp. VKM Ac-2857]NRG42926.1 sugar ABC transporter permease [Rathayibacter sp. VKM Ac-2835]ROS20810.1 carbohydrate ABC transporter membrane protein 1 (CUT1 family) [Rathayibacter sp. PhB127]
MSVALGKKDARTGLLMILPALVLVVVFVVVPLLFAVVISVTDWPLVGTVGFVGFDNYATAFSDTTFWASVLYTLGFAVVSTLLGIVVGYLLAVLVRSNRRGAGIIRTAVFVPYVIGLTSLSFVALLEFRPDSGALDQVLMAVGLTDAPTAWLLDATSATTLIVLLGAYVGSGFTMIVLMSGMQGIDDALYESAAIDGAGRWKQEFLVTVPLVKRYLGLLSVLGFVGAILAFTQFYVITGGGPGTGTLTVMLYVYNKAFGDLQVGYATALSFVVVVIAAALTLLQFRVMKDD